MTSRTTRKVAAYASAVALTLTTLTMGTSSVHASPIIIAAAGDISRATVGRPQQDTARLIAGLNPAKVFALGDEQYPDGEYENFLASYDPTWGSFNSIVAPVPGDQDYGTPGAAGYFQYFANVLSRYGQSATDPTRAYYSFDVGDWHAVALNANCSQPGLSCTAERKWLAADLTADRHLCEIVFYHQPGKKGFATTAASLGVELVLSGHRHVYERRDHVYGLDLRQMIVGTGGKSLGTPEEGADVSVKAYGVLELALDTTSYSWEFVDRAGSVRDSGSDVCHA